MGWRRHRGGGRKQLCCSVAPRGREEGREMLPAGRRLVGSRCRRMVQTTVLSPRAFRSPAPPSVGCNLPQNVSVAACPATCCFSVATWRINFIVKFLLIASKWLTHLRIVAWLPGLVREHWPRGKVEVISMMSSSSSSSTSTVSVLYDRAWGSPAG